MSTNKLKYWNVTTTQIIKAENKTEAFAAASRKRVPGTQVLMTERHADRISAVEAHELVSEFV